MLQSKAAMDFASANGACNPSAMSSMIRVGGANPQHFGFESSFLPSTLFEFPTVHV